MCSRGQCRRWFQTTYRRSKGADVPHKTCPPCRDRECAIAKRYAQTAHGKAKKAQWELSHATQRKETNNRFDQSQKGREKRKRYRNSDAGKAANSQFWQSEQGKQTRSVANERRRANASYRCLDAYCASLRDRVVRPDAEMSQRLRELGDFVNVADIRDHLASTFDSGMSWQNYGTRGQKSTGASWDIGHRVAVACFNGEDEEDVRRCMSRNNIFAQWRTANRTLGVTLPSTEWMRCNIDLLPVGWRNKVPTGDVRKHVEDEARHGRHVAL